MEILKVNQDGKLTCYIRCETHNFFYKGQPPLTTGCTSCWMTYYMGQRAQMPKEKHEESLAELDTALTHMVEHLDAGTWDVEWDDIPTVVIEKDIELEAN